MPREHKTQRRHGFASCLTAGRVLVVTTLAFGYAFLLASFHANAQSPNSGGVEIWHGTQQIRGKSKVIDIMPGPRSIHPNKELALELLTEARLLADDGEFDKAAEFARHANALGMQWDDNEQSPDQFLFELARKQNPSASSNASEADPLFNGSSQPLPNGVRPIDSDGSWQIENAADNSPLVAPAVPTDDNATPQADANQTTAHAPAAPIRLRTTPSIDEAGGQSAANNKDSLWTAAFVQLLSTLVGVLVGVALLAAAAVFLFRRYGGQLGPVFRVELVNTEGSGLAIQPAGAQSISGAAGDGESYAPIQVRDFSTEDIPLTMPGQSYFDQKEQDDDEFRRREEAILKVVFEENLELREQLQDSRRAAA